MQLNSETSSSVNPSAGNGALWLKLAVLYLIAGVSLGIAMGASENFVMRPVHAHLNLLGWTTMALAGVVYTVFPQAGLSRLATIHFWLHNVSLPIMMGALSLLLLGHTQVVPVLAASEMVAAAGVLVFACNIFMNVNHASKPARAAMPQHARAAA
jgi:cbb3-type cytochrome oxidase subunit 1